jgi:hypothetical protein
VVLGDGTRAFHLRFRAAGQRQRELVHERAASVCRCGGGWDQRAARTEPGNLLARVRAVPHTTPHSLRRTYISIALLANNFDVKWVMSQVGHADSKMTLDVYAQLEQRVERSHGAAFDSLVRAARDQLHARRPGAAEGVHWATNGPRDPENCPVAACRSRRRPQGLCRFAGHSPYGETRTRTGDTTIFSRVLYQLSYLAARRTMLASRRTRLPGR